MKNEKHRVKHTFQYYFFMQSIIDTILFSYSKKNKNCIYDYNNKSYIFD